MDYVEARDLVRIRQQLREHLRAERVAEAQIVLGQLLDLAGADPELRGEYQRWCLQFGVLPGDPTAAAA